MTRHGTGWFQYAPMASSRSVLSFDSDPVQGEDVARPELADVGRLGRRAMRGFVRAARVDLAPTLHRSLREHLGPLAPDVAVVEESWRSYDQVNVQAGLDAWLAEPNRTFDLLGVAGFQHGRFGLADLLNPAATPQPWDPRPGNVATVNIASGPDGQVRACVVCAIYLVSEGERRTAVLLRGPDEDGEHGVLLQVVSTEPGAAAQVASDVRGLALAHNVFRGQVLSFGGEMFEPGSTFMKFHRRPELDRAGLVLPEGVLDTIERQVVDIGVHRDRLLASGQHLKRGLLLYGPPGTGKTHTVRYLLGRTDGVTVIELTGAALHLIAEACSVARTLAPSMVVVEDVDLIAEERHAFGGPAPTAVPAAQRDGRARRRRGRGLPAHHEPGRPARAGPGRTPWPGRPSRRARSAGRDRASSAAAPLPRASRAGRRAPRRDGSADRRGDGLVPQRAAPAGGSAGR